MTNPLQIGFLVFPDVTQLDLTGPAQVLSRVPGARVHLAWKTLEPLKTDVGFSLNPTTSFADCPPLDVLCVPGGMGVVGQINDAETLAFLRQQAPARATSHLSATAHCCWARRGCCRVTGQPATGCGGIT